MTDRELEVLRVAAFIFAALLAALLQRAFPHDRLKGSLRVNLALWLADIAVMAGVCSACGFTVARHVEAASFGVLNALDLPAAVNGLFSIAALDLVSYGWHRANHALPLLWRFHQVHHSDPNYTVSTGVRFHPGELVLALPVRLIAVAAIGVPPFALLAFEVVFAIANLLEHGDIDLPPRLEAAIGRLLIVPALHRRHHSEVRRERDSNFGTIFSVWDRVFGTLRPSASVDRIAVGLPGDASCRGVLRAFLLPSYSMRRVP